MLLSAYYSQNYAGIIRPSLPLSHIEQAAAVFDNTVHA